MRISKSRVIKAANSVGIGFHRMSDEYCDSAGLERGTVTHATVSVERLQALVDRIFDEEDKKKEPESNISPEKQGAKIAIAELPVALGSVMASNSDLLFGELHVHAVRKLGHFRVLKVEMSRHSDSLKAVLEVGASASLPCRVASWTIRKPTEGEVTAWIQG